MNNQNFTIKRIKGVPTEENLATLLQLYSKIFNDADVSLFNERISSKKNVISLIAYYNSIPVGFKIGYHCNDTTFYSWLGGVIKNYRKKGIASSLAITQEDLVKEKNYKKIRTKSMNCYKPMLILNIKNGFNITNVYTNAKSQTKIVFEKTPFFKFSLKKNTFFKVFFVCNVFLLYF